MIPTTGLRAWIPRPLVRLIKRAYRIGWYGDYPDWQTACRHARGYDDPAISERVADATRRVLAGEGDHERDSVIIQHASPRWPVLASLLHILALDRHLRVLDFGGSLASTLYQHRRWLVGRSGVEWMVVEQPSFVEQGCRLFAEEVVRFASSLPDPGVYRPRGGIRHVVAPLRRVRLRQPRVRQPRVIRRGVRDPAGSIRHGIHRG